MAQYNKVKMFRSESFWYIYLSLAAQHSEGEEISFSWRRGHLFDREITDILYRVVMEAEFARVVKVVQKETKKWLVALDI